MEPKDLVALLVKLKNEMPDFYRHLIGLIKSVIKN